nr:hypothetical protein [Tanacetum cinerariifolium]
MNAVLETLTIILQAMVDTTMRNGNRTLKTNRMNGKGVGCTNVSSFSRWTMWLTILRFVNAFDDPFVKIKNVRHVTTIEDYQNAFDRLISRVDFPIDRLVHEAAIKVNKQKYKAPLSPTLSVPHFQTIRVCGQVGEYSIHILIDSGSTHNFVDTNTAKKIGCKISAAVPLQLDVASGNKVVSVIVCNKFTWKLQGEIFETDGIKLKMAFEYKGRTVTLRGTQKSTLQCMHGKKMAQPVVKLSSLMLCIYLLSKLSMIHGSDEKNKQKQDPAIVQLLHNYEDMFVVPNILP